MMHCMAIAETHSTLLLWVSAIRREKTASCNKVLQLNIYLL